jgi:hypothetical protein
MKFSLGAALAISLSLASCGAKDAPKRITLKIDGPYSGTVRLRPCRRGAEEAVVIDQQGQGETSICPYGELEIVVIKQSKPFYLPSESITVEKTGDGIPVLITARIP